MRIKFAEQLKQLNTEMVLMSNMVQKSIQDTVSAFFRQDTQMAEQIMNDDELVDQQQKKIENLCFGLLVQQQPVAGDLRTITAAMKMVTDLERIGDQAADIAELTIMIADSDLKLDSEHIKQMSAETVMMVLKAVEAYVERDEAKASEVIGRDDIVDDLFVKVKKDLIEIMQKNPEQAEYAADLLMVNKYLERIGDHATNIAEWVLFSCGQNRAKI